MTTEALYAIALVLVCFAQRISAVRICERMAKIEKQDRLRGMWCSAVSKELDTFLELAKANQKKTSAVCDILRDHQECINAITRRN